MKKATFQAILALPQKGRYGWPRQVIRDLAFHCGRGHEATEVVTALRCLVGRFETGYPPGFELPEYILVNRQNVLRLEALITLAATCGESDQDVGRLLGYAS